MPTRSLALSHGRSTSAPAAVGCRAACSVGLTSALTRGAQRRLSGRSGAERGLPPFLAVQPAAQDPNERPSGATRGQPAIRLRIIAVMWSRGQRDPSRRNASTRKSAYSDLPYVSNAFLLAFS